ncbi:MAG: ABC-2 family transporter protein [Candidatus Margulisbacteria bacterium]|nr:ABC-2 family transporter protein [Candidatus Margulisiibacteriota bacterium]
MGVFHYIELYLSFSSQHLKKILEYRLSFLIGIIPFILLQLSGIVVIWAIFKKVPNIAGFSFDEILFIYGLGIACYALGRMLFSNLENLGYQYIIKGELDAILTKPINPLFHILASGFSEKEIGELVVGIVLIIKSIIGLSIDFGILEFFVLLYFLINGVVIYGSMNLIAVVICFWTKDTRGLTSPIMRIQEFSQYPVTIYGKTIRFIITWMLPFAFISFFPAAFFIRNKEFAGYIFCIPLIGIIFPIIAYLLWLKGLSKYESSGT